MVVKKNHSQLDASSQGRVDQFSSGRGTKWRLVTVMRGSQITRSVYLTMSNDEKRAIFFLILLENCAFCKSVREKLAKQ